MPAGFPDLTSSIGRLSRLVRPVPGGSEGSGQVARPYPRELRVHRRRNPAAVIFWAALEPAERKAFRSVAVSRTYAAGTWLIREDDPADHVIVILSGRTKICVEEDGRERVLAERGPGQLVGERGALHVSVRSASVIALETVRALVVRTADFAAFISEHPTVLDLVESQLYDRLTEDPAASRPADTAAPSPVAVPRPPARQHPQLLDGENCTVILSDVAGFGSRDRTDDDRRMIREALFSMTHGALQGLPDVWSWDDRGDGVLTVIPPSVSTARIIQHLHRELPAILGDYNGAHHETARIQLRMAVNVGPVASDIMGVTGEAIIVTARLVDAPLFKQAMAVTRASLGLIASAFVYETVIRHAQDATGYAPVQVEVKESSMVAWMRLFGPAAGPAAIAGAARSGPGFP